MLLLLLLTYSVSTYKRPRYLQVEHEPEAGGIASVISIA